MGAVKPADYPLLVTTWVNGLGRETYRAWTWDEAHRVDQTMRELGWHLDASISREQAYLAEMTP